jgi:serine phosphatase RsbU (regulator of sigma subunit)
MLAGYFASLVGFFMGNILLAFLFIEVVVRKREDYFYIPLSLFFFGGAISCVGQSMVYQFTLANNMAMILVGEKIQHLGLFILFPGWIHFIYRYFFNVRTNFLIIFNYVFSFIFIPILFFTELLFVPKPFVFKDFYSFASGPLYTPIMAYCFINILLGAVLIIFNFLREKHHKIQNLFFSLGAAIAALTGMKDIAETWYHTSLPQVYTFGIILTAVSHFVIIVSRLKELDQQATRQREIEQELGFARTIQETFIAPRFDEQTSFFQVAALNMPGMYLGGDLYHVERCSQDKYLFVIGDIAGKGVSASLYMSFLLSFFKTLPKVSIERHFDSLPRKANNNMLMYAKDGMFATCFAGLMDFRKRRLTFFNAGHQYPLLISATRCDRRLSLNAPGMPFGISQNADFSVKSVQIQHGDFLFLHTDGLEDAWNRKKKLFDLAEVEKAIIKNASSPPDEIIGKILELRKGFKHSEYIEDDITLMLVKIL